MLHNFRISSIIIVGVLTSSILLFPESGDIHNTPLAKSLKKVELQVERMQGTKQSSMAVWREFQSSLLEEFTTINVTDLSDEEVNYMFKKLKNLALPIIKSVLTQGAKGLNNFSDYERYLLSALVESSQKMVKKNSIAYRFMNHIKKKLDATNKSPFEYLKGNAGDINLVSQVKFFSWNTCFLPGNLSKTLAGLEPWQERFDLVVNKILEQDADVVCLQEVYSEAASLKLYDKLKTHYAHFYMNMGPTVMGSKMSEVGLSSGLFVASKFQLQNSYFEMFKSNKEVSQVNKGFFSASLPTNDLAFVTSHLEPFDDNQAMLEREGQLNVVISYMKKLPAKIKLLMGDLNIPFGCKEPAENLISTYFYDPYNKNRLSISKHSRTYSDHFVTKNKEGNHTILDYFLVMQDPGFEKYAYVIERVEGFDELTLESKGSDHHGLFSQVVFPYSEK